MSEVKKEVRRERIAAREHRPVPREVRRSAQEEPRVLQERRAQTADKAPVSKPKRKRRRHWLWVLIILLLIILAGLGDQETSEQEMAVPALTVSPERHIDEPENGTPQEEQTTQDREPSGAEDHDDSARTAAASMASEPLTVQTAPRTTPTPAAPAPAPSASPTPAAPDPVPSASPSPSAVPTAAPGMSPPPVHAHEFLFKTCRAATCTGAGDEIGTCSCGTEVHRTIPALGHAYVEYVDGMGKTVLQCTRCGETLRK